MFCLIAFMVIQAKAFAFDKNVSSSLNHYILAVMYDRLGKIDQAIEEYKKALKTDSKSLIIHLNLATTYIKDNKLDQAIEELNACINIDSEAVEPHAILALLYSLQNKLELATGQYEEALKNASKLQPKNIDIYKSLGIVYLQQKKYKEAENIYSLILGLSNTDAESHFYLGTVYYELHNKEKSEKELKKALELKPDYDEALNYLGYCYVEDNKNLDQAEVMIKKALGIKPDSGAYVDSLGWLYFKRGKIKEALKELERAAKLLEDPEIYKHLGQAQFKMGDIENAKLNWQKSLKLNPKQDDLRAQLEKLK